MSECLRCGRELIDPNAKYGWRCAEKVGIPYGNGGSIVKKFPELEKLYNFLPDTSKKKFDKYFDEMEEKSSYIDTAIEGAGMYMSIADELEKAYNEEVSKKNAQNQRVDNLLKTKIEFEKNKKLQELLALDKMIEQYQNGNMTFGDELDNKIQPEPIKIWTKEDIVLDENDKKLSIPNQEKLIEAKLKWHNAATDVERELAASAGKQIREEDFKTKASEQSKQEAKEKKYPKWFEDLIYKKKLEWWQKSSIGESDNAQKIADDANSLREMYNSLSKNNALNEQIIDNFLKYDKSMTSGVIKDLALELQRNQRTIDIMNEQFPNETFGNDIKQAFLDYYNELSYGKTFENASDEEKGNHKRMIQTHLDNIKAVSDKYDIAVAKEQKLKKSNSHSNGEKISINSVLYGGNSKGKLTCNFDGYTSTSGRHEGLDFASGFGNPIYSLCDGEVINVAKSNNGLTTIAIYDENTNKTVIYLHSDPTVQIGDKIKVGDKIGTESNKDSPKFVHTHVELRDGKQKNASKSVSAPVLNNENPAPYWISKGYIIE